MKMVKEDIAYELRTAVSQAKKQEKAVKKEGLHIRLNGSAKELDIEVVPIKGNAKNIYFLIVFQENGSTEKTVSPSNQKTKDKKNDEVNNKRMTLLEEQLRDARDSMRIMSE